LNDAHFVPCPQRPQNDMRLPVPQPKCPQCGIKLHEALRYVCTRVGSCPTGLAEAKRR